MARAGPAVPLEMYDDNIIAWKPGVNQAAPQKGAQTVTFFLKPRINPELSKQDGRPRYDKKPYIRVTQPGDRDNIVTRECWIDETGQYEMADNIRFPEQWERFTKQNDGDLMGPTGTPLSAWPALGTEQVEELKHFNIFTVEELAGMTEGNVSRFMGLRALQRMAVDFLEAAKDGSVVTRLHGELEELRVRAKSTEDTAREQAETIRQLREMLEAQKRGRDAAVQAGEDDADTLGHRSLGGAQGEEQLPPAGEVAEGLQKQSGGSFLRPKKAK